MKTVSTNPVAFILSFSLLFNLGTFTFLPSISNAAYIVREHEDLEELDHAATEELRARLEKAYDNPPQPSNISADPPVSAQDVQAVAHIIGSHAKLVMRPVTFLYRLVFMVLHTGVDTIKWTWRIAYKNRPVSPLSGSAGMDLEEWESELDRITGSPSSMGTMRYLIDGEEFFPRLVEALTEARESIDMRTYIFDNDDYATRIARLLRERSAEADVRVLFDGLGTILATRNDPESMPPGYQPPRSMRAFLTNESRVKVRQKTNPLFTFDHSKTTIIDHKLAFLGGMNIGREYRFDWHDMMVELQGPIVHSLEHEFDKAWAHAGFWGDLGKLFHSFKPLKKKPKDYGIPLRALFTRADDSEIYRAQLAAIRRAKKFIYIQNAYFSDDAILYELVKARRRGVDVRVILPIKGNWNTMNSSNVLATNAMLENGIRVFLFPGMSHIKAAVYDGWACLGSANFDKASLRFNGEINVATSHQQTVDELINRLFVPDFDKSIELKQALPEKLSHYFAEAMADLL